MKIGFACKWLDNNGIVMESHNEKGTTVKAIEAKTMKDRFDRIYELTRHNIESLKNRVDELIKGPEELRMMRIGSGFVPVATHESCKEVYNDNDFRSFMEKSLRPIGDKMRKHGIRPSMHPGQFTILNNTDEIITQRSIDDLEYHADLFRWMGYTRWHEDGLDINIHGGGKSNGLAQFRKNVGKLSTEVRNWLTVENDEFSFGLDDLLELSDIIPVLPDVHHHWVFTHGEKIQPNDDRLKRVIDSWRGVRPEMHVSMPQQTIDEKTVDLSKPFSDIGFPRGKLRKHSYDPWNKNWVEWFLSFTEFDLMYEGKSKNLGANAIYNEMVR